MLNKLRYFLNKLEFQNNFEDIKGSAVTKIVKNIDLVVRGHSKNM
jgi:hypothetical protein